MAYHGGYEKVSHLHDIFDNKDNISFFLHYAEKKESILDVGAGTGRIAIPIAEGGIKVYCVEPSPAMCREFKRKISWKREIEDNIILINSDASSYKFRKVSPLVVLSGTFDHFLDDNERISALENIHRHMEPGGKLIFDVFIGLMKDSSLHPAGFVKDENLEYRRYTENRILPEGIMEVLLVYEIYENGRLIERVEQESSAGITNRDKIHALLERTGFKIDREFGDYKFTPFKEGDDLLIIEAIKK